MHISLQPLSDQRSGQSGGRNSPELCAFYADRALRHQLSERVWVRLVRELDQLLLKETYQPLEAEFSDIGYVFCPEHRSGGPERLYAKDGDEARLWLFGPSLLPEERAAATASTNSQINTDDITANSFEISTLVPGQTTLADEASPIRSVEVDSSGSADEIQTSGLTEKKEPVSVRLAKTPQRGRSSRLEFIRYVEILIL